MKQQEEGPIKIPLLAARIPFRRILLVDGSKVVLRHSPSLRLRCRVRCFARINGVRNKTLKTNGRAYRPHAIELGIGDNRIQWRRPAIFAYAPSVL